MCSGYSLADLDIIAIKIEGVSDTISLLAACAENNNLSLDDYPKAMSLLSSVARGFSNQLNIIRDDLFKQNQENL